MAQDAPARPATYADLEAVPPHLVAEIIGGRLYTRPRLRPRHAWTYSRLGVVIGSKFGLGDGGPGGWMILDKPELHLDRDVVVPDIAGWRRERMPALPDEAWFSLAPDWVCEILSPSTAQLDRTAKREIYAAHGVSHLWLVDPESRFIEAFALKDGLWLLLATYCGEGAVAIQPFEAAPFELKLLWPD
ncbi:MAG: Uma2 family endonuclease [Hyphomicrobiaceae bacterium]|nr:Uma2 family endonuclease [Hyphomicrobiaceae bacterium]